jgi:hypothetical protein
MKTHTLLRKVRSWRSFAFALLLVISTFAGSLSGLTSPTPTANALDDGQMQKCYDTFNGRDLNGLKGMTLAEQDLYNQVCKPFCKALDNNGDVTKPLIITCPNPTSLRQIEDAEVAPLVTLVCGAAPAGEAAQSAYVVCADQARAAYKECDNFIVPITGPVQDTDANTAACTRNHLGSPKPALAAVLKAVTKGRNDAKAAATAAVTEQQQAEEKAKCEADGGTWTDNKCNPKGTDEDKTTCAVEGIGWIICPVVNLMSKLVDAAYGFVSSLLKVQPLLTTGQTKGVFDAWSLMRNFANVAFVIAFMIIIFSQLTSVGVTNYGIKKMLPRLIVAAILVNISYWVCAIAIDASNIIGSSLKDLFDSIGASLKTPDLSDASTGNGWEGIAGAILAGTVGAGIVFYIGLSALIPALLAAALAIVTVFLVLTLRQALIILLIVVAPLAFVAYLLPNTEGLFKKWRDLFQTLLLMYPIIALIFGASAFASKIVMTTGTGDYKIAVQIMGALIAIIPLAITPIVMRTAGGILNRFGGYINNPNKGPFDRMRKRAEGLKDYRQNINRTRRIERADKFLNKGGPLAPGEKRSRSRRLGAWIAGSGATYGVNNEQREANAKRALHEEQQSYVAGRASNEEKYAKSIASPTGNVEAVVASAQDVVRQEYIDNVKRIKGQYASSGKTGDEVLAEIIADQTGDKKMSSEQLGAAIQHITENGRAQAQQNLVDFMGQLGTERAGLDPTSARASLLKDAQQMAASGLANSKVKPKSLSASEVAKMNAGEFTKDMDQLMNTYLGEGKMSKEKVANMDIDEIFHMQNMVQQGRLSLDPAAKAATKAAIDGLIGAADPSDPTGVKRINADSILVGKLENRQIKALDDIKARL